MTTVALTEDARVTLQISSTWQHSKGRDVKTVLLWVYRGGRWMLSLTFTPDEARALADALAHEADHIDAAASGKG